MLAICFFVALTIVLVEFLHSHLESRSVSTAPEPVSEDDGPASQPPQPTDAAPAEPDVRAEFIARVAGEPKPDGTRIGRAFVWQCGEVVMNISKDHKGRSIVDMTRDPRGCGFFRWMLGQDFSWQEKELARRCLENRRLIVEADPWW